MSEKDFIHKLEQQIGSFELISDLALISIAISLKRIADAIDHDKAKTSAEYEAGVAAIRKSMTP